MALAKKLRIKRRDQPLKLCPRWKNKAKPGVRGNHGFGNEKGLRGDFPYIFLMKV